MQYNVEVNCLDLHHWQNADNTEWVTVVPWHRNRVTLDFWLTPDTHGVPLKAPCQRQKSGLHAKTVSHPKTPTAALVPHSGHWEKIPMMPPAWVSRECNAYFWWKLPSSFAEQNQLKGQSNTEKAQRIQSLFKMKHLEQTTNCISHNSRQKQVQPAFPWHQHKNSNKQHNLRI